MSYRREYLHRDGRPPPPPYFKHKSNIDPSASSANTSMPGDFRFTPEIFKDMSKKIVQLTKVICSLTNKVEDQELLLESEKSQQEETIQRLQTEAKQQVSEYQTKIKELEIRLDEERKCRLKKEEELQILKQLSSISENCRSLKHSLKFNPLGEAQSNGEGSLDDLEQFRRELSAERNLINIFLNPRLPVQRPELFPNGSSELSFIGSKLKDVDKHQEEFRSLINDCGNLGVRKTLLTKHDTHLRYFEETTDGMSEMERIFSMASKADKSLTEKTLKEQLDRQDLQFRKKMAEVLQHLSQSEGRCEKYSKENKHFEQSLSTRDKELCEVKDELRRVASELHRFQDTLDTTKKLCTRQSQEISVKTEQVNRLEEEKNKFQSELLTTKMGEQVLVKKIENLEKEAENLRHTLTNKMITDEEQCMIRQREFESKLNTLKEGHDEDRRRLELFFNEKLQSLILSSKQKENYLKAQMEESKKHYEHQLEEERKVHGEIQDNLEQQLDFLHWNVQLSLRSESEKTDSLQLHLEEKEHLLEQTQKEIRELRDEEQKSQQNVWHENFGKLRKDATSAEEKIINQAVSSLHPKNECGSQTDEMIDSEKLKPDILKAFKCLWERIHRLEDEKEDLLKEREETHDTHYSEIKVQSEAKKADLEELKQLLQKNSEEKHELKKISEENLGDAMDYSEKVKMEEIRQQNESLKVEVQEFRKKCTDLHEEMYKKEQNLFAKEVLLLQDLSTTQNQVQCLTDMVQSLKSEQDKITTEREKKMNQLLRVREEAAQQIKNLETYWQARLVRELKKAAHAFENEKQKITSHFDKKLRLLKDKIILLQKTIKDLQDSNSKKQFTAENNSDVQELRKTIADKDSTIYNLKEEKKILQTEFLHQKIDAMKTYSSVNNLEAIFPLKKPCLERLPLTPQFVRRHSLLGSMEQKQKWLCARSQSPFRATQSTSPVSKPSLPKVSTHRASWTGEIPNDINSTVQLSELLNSDINENQKTYCTEIKNPISIEHVKAENTKPWHTVLEPDNHKEWDTKLHHDSALAHACDTISECDEIFMITNNNENHKSKYKSI